jgi:hypothetical protein
LDAATRRGCRIWGRAEVLDSGERFNGMNEGLAARKLQAKHVVFVSVDDFAVFQSGRAVDVGSRGRKEGREPWE